MQKILLLLSVVGVFYFGSNAFAASQVWCTGQTCGNLASFCLGSHHWCLGDRSDLSYGSYKYCIPWSGNYIVDSAGEISDDTGVVCFTSQADCNKIKQGKVVWNWDPTDHVAYMHPESGYFFWCSTSSGYKSSATYLDMYACAPGHYQRYSTRKLVIETDGTSSGEYGCESCAAGTYSLGRTYSCRTCPSNSTCTGTGNYNFSCNSGYYGTESAAYGGTPSGTCTVCPTADSGWTRASITGSTTYSGCYEYQTPAGCSSGTVKRNASSTSAYSSTVQLNSPLTAAPGYFRPGATATYCQRCPEQDGAYGTNTGAAESATECFMSSSSVLTDTYGSYSFTDACYYCTNTCSTQSECRSSNYDTCSNGCCSGYCASGVFALSQSACVSQGYPTYTASNHCCSGSCGTLGVACSTVTQCRNAGYNNSATCSSGCCSGSKCTASYGASGNTTGRCTSDADCKADTSTDDYSCNTTTGCCVHSTISSCTYGSCTKDTDCASGTCTTSTGCCTRPIDLTLCSSPTTYCDRNTDCIISGADCTCSCDTTRHRCLCSPSSGIKL